MMFKFVVFLTIFTVIMYIFLLLPDSIKPDEINEKRVLVTGASQNIGKQLAIEFSRLGAHVVVTARNEKRLKQVVQLCLNEGASSANFIVADMSQLNETEEVISKAVNFLGGGIDFLVLNHISPVPDKNVWTGSKSNFDYIAKAASVNYLSYVHLSSHATSHLNEANGRLVIVSSIAGHINTPFSPAYASTKAAINRFYSNLRLEMLLPESKSDYSITICLLGYIETEDVVFRDSVAIQGYSMVDTAREIIAGAASRRAYIYVPTWGVVSSIFRLFSSDWFDELLISISYT